MPVISYYQFEAEQLAAGVAFNYITVPDYGTVKFFELSKEGPHLSYQARVHRCERTFRVWPYEKAWAFCTWMCGWSKLGSASAGTASGVFRLPPQPLPIFNRPSSPGPAGVAGLPKPFAWATDVVRFKGVRPDGVTFSPFDGTTVCGNFWFADVTIAYGSLPYRIKPDSEMTLDSSTQEPDESSLARYVSRTYAPSGKHIQFPTGALKWEGVIDNSPGAPSGAEQRSTQTAGKVLPFCDVVYIWHEVPAVPRSVFTHIGSVNQYPFDGSAAETLLLVGVEIQPRRMVTGDRAFDVMYRMKHYTVDGTKNHNYFYRVQPSSGKTYSDVTWTLNRAYYKDDAGAKHYVFEKKDFRDLFRGPFEQRWIGP